MHARTIEHSLGAFALAAGLALAPSLAAAQVTAPTATLRIDGARAEPYRILVEPADAEPPPAVGPVVHRCQAPCGAELTPAPWRVDVRWPDGEHRTEILELTAAGIEPRAYQRPGESPARPPLRARVGVGLFLGGTIALAVGSITMFSSIFFLFGPASVGLPLLYGGGITACLGMVSVATGLALHASHEGGASRMQLTRVTPYLAPTRDGAYAGVSVVF